MPVEIIPKLGMVARLNSNPDILFLFDSRFMTIQNCSSVQQSNTVISHFTGKSILFYFISDVPILVSSLFILQNCVNLHSVVIAAFRCFSFRL